MQSSTVVSDRSLSRFSRRLMGRPRRRTVSMQAVGDKLQDWVKSPLYVATFGPRVALGALLTAPQRLSELPSDLNKVREVLTGPISTNEKANILLEEVELRLVDCLERGATVESDIYQNLRSMLPDNVRQNIPTASPFIPNMDATPNDPTSQTDNVTYSPSTVTEEKTYSETTGLSDAIVALKTARSALKTNTSAAREKMLMMNLREEREFLQNILSEIDVQAEGIDTLIVEAEQLIADTEEML